MAETKARFLANTIGATTASNDFSLPDGVGTANQVISSNADGTTQWKATLSSPTISSVTGILNAAESGVSEDGGVLTIIGTDFGLDTSVISVQIAGATSFSTVAETSTIAFVSGYTGTRITATFTGAESNFDHSTFAAGSTIYVKITKSSLQSSTYATLATAVTGDPSFTTTTTPNSSHTGTLASTSLGSYGGQVTGGGEDINTKLLLNFDRIYGTDIEDSSNTGGDGHKITVSNDAVIKSSPFGDGGTAIYFDGTDDQLSIPATSDFTFSTNSFTIEFWVNFNDTNTHRILGSNADFHGLGIALYSSKIRIYVGNGSSWATSYDSTSSLVAGRWYHIALVRNSGVFKMYFDGIEDISTSDTNDYSDYDNNLYIGRNQGTADQFDGYLDEIRIVNGTNATDGAVYSGDFTVPNSRLTAIANTKLLIHSNSTEDSDVFTDSTTNHTPSASGGTKHSKLHGAIAPPMPFPASGKLTGSSGIYFDGNADYISTPLAGSGIPTGNSARTVEAWFYILSHVSDSSNPQDYGWSYGSGDTKRQWGLRLIQQAGNANRYVTSQHHGADYLSSVETSSLLNTWTHIAQVYNGSYIRLYINGKNVINQAISDLNTNTTGNFYLGVGGTYGTTQQYSFKGYIDQLRISDSARYSGTNSSSEWSNFNQPTKIYGEFRGQDVGTIQLNASAGTGGGALDYAELSGGTALSTYGLSLSSSGAITGTLSGLSTSGANSGGVIRIRARANTDDNRLTTLGAASFTSITQNGGVASAVLFNARRYVGNGLARELNGFKFQPDFIWLKNRDDFQSYMMYDSVRGTDSYLYSDSNLAQGSGAGERVSFTADGISLASGQTNNADTKANIAWGWKAGGKPSSSALSLSGGVGAGTIADNATGVSGVKTITQSVNQNSGFSITAYTGNTNSGTASFPHNLGGAPDFVLVKKLSETTWGWWVAYHSSLTDNYNLQLNEAISQYVSTNTTYAKGGWIDGPTSTLINLSSGSSNTDSVSYINKTYICYAWKAVSGVSAFGSFSGSGSGTSVTTTDGSTSIGFRPKYLMIKRINDTGPWLIYDTIRFGTSNVTGVLEADDNKTESSAFGNNRRFALGEDQSGSSINGFSFPASNENSVGGSGTFIFMAFA